MKCFFIDIDSTLMWDGIIPKANIDAINNARGKGHKVFINTGRSYGYVPKTVFESIKTDGGVYGLGTYILCENNVIFNKPIPNDMVCDLIELFIKNKKWIVLEGLSDVYALNHQYLKQKEITGIDNFKCKCGNDVVSKFSCDVLSEDEKILLSKKFAINNFPVYSEGSILGTGKKEGIRTIIEYLGVSPEDCIAIGDSINDLGMFEICGRSVAMGNAPDEVKKSASYIACHSKDGGVAEAINKFSV